MKHYLMLNSQVAQSVLRKIFLSLQSNIRDRGAWYQITVSDASFVLENCKCSLTLFQSLIFYTFSAVNVLFSMSIVRL